MRAGKLTLKTRTKVPFLPPSASAYRLLDHSSDVAVLSPTSCGLKRPGNDLYPKSVQAFKNIRASHLIPSASCVLPGTQFGATVRASSQRSGPKSLESSDGPGAPYSIVLS